MPAGESRGPWPQILKFLKDAANWMDRHEPEMTALATWGAVGYAGRTARLYVPVHEEGWNQIKEAGDDADTDGPPDYEALIVSIYGPGGVAFYALRDELLQAPLLEDRRVEVGEVLSSLADGRYFVTVCGALPLVEYVLSNAAGKWNDPRKHLGALDARLDGAISPDVEAELLIEATAVEMLLSEIPEIWKDGRQNVGVINEKLNRHLALHGTARGWNDVSNATRAVLLLAAAARVAGPLLQPPPPPLEAQQT